MALNSVGWIAVAEDRGFQRRVELSLARASVAAMNELLTATCHTERVAFSGKVLGGEANIRSAAYAVMSNATLRTNADSTDTTGMHGITDNDLDFAVDSVFNALSGCDQST